MPYTYVLHCIKRHAFFVSNVVNKKFRKHVSSIFIHIERMDKLGIRSDFGTLPKCACLVFSALNLQLTIYLGQVCSHICSAQCGNLRNLEIAFRILGILRLRNLGIA